MAETTEDTNTTTEQTQAEKLAALKIKNAEDNEKLARAKFSEGLRNLMSFEVEFEGYIPELHTNMFIWFELPKQHVLANYANMVAGIDKTTTRGGEYILNRYYVEKIDTSFGENGITTKVTLNPFASNLSSYYKIYLEAIKAYQQANCESDNSTSSDSSDSSSSGSGSNSVQQALTAMPPSGCPTITVTGKPSTAGSMPPYQYKTYTKTWYNFCPVCGRTGTLVDNPKGVPEHELTCRPQGKASLCDTDWDVVTGRNKAGNGRGSAYKNVFLVDSNGKRNSIGNIDTSVGGGTSTAGESSGANCVNSGSLGNSDTSVPASVQSFANSATSSNNPKQIVIDCAMAVRRKLNWTGSYSGFRYTSDQVLKRGSSNCCDGSRLLAEMCAYKGVYLEYVHVRGGKGGHVFNRYNGTYVDWIKMRSASNFGDYVTGYGSPPGKVTKYPTKPF